MKTGYYNRIERLHKEYKSLNLYDAIDYEKYKLYAIVTSSTQLEGATLTELDTQLLLDEGITAAGKPLEHHNMVKDNYEAMKYALMKGDEKILLSPEFLKKLNAINMSTTGAIINRVNVNLFNNAMDLFLF